MDLDAFKYRLKVEEARVKLTRYVEMNGRKVRPRYVPCATCVMPHPVESYVVIDAEGMEPFHKDNPFIRWVAPHVHIWNQCVECLCKESAWTLDEIEKYTLWEPPDFPLWDWRVPF